MFAFMLTGVMSLATTAPVTADDNWASQTLRPLNAASLQAGGAHVVSYFQKEEGACRLTMMMANGSAGPATRIQMTVAPGRTARVDEVDGKSSLFTCLANAEAMNVLRTDHVAKRGARLSV